MMQVLSSQKDKNKYAIEVLPVNILAEGTKPTAQYYCITEPVRPKGASYHYRELSLTFAERDE